MKKKFLLMSTIGFAAGLVYALESRRRKQSAADNESLDEGSAGEGRAEKVSRGAANNSASQTSRDGSIAKLENGKAAVSEGEARHAIDDQGTTQADASRILREIRDHAFEASNEKLALALGRPTEEIEQWTSGSGLIDGDVMIKARALSLQRGLAVE